MEKKTIDITKYRLILDNYVFMEDEIESLIVFKIYYKNDMIDIIKINYTCNPLLDVDLMNLRDLDLVSVIKKLNKMILGKQYSSKHNQAILNFRNTLFHFLESKLEVHH